MATKKLIEVALPLEKINNAAAYEKMPGIGAHPRGIHLWWARRPFTVARAILWASIVDDPSSHTDIFKSDEEQNAERKRLFSILEELADWKNSSNASIINKAKEEIKSTGLEKLAVLDPFAGGGAIPLEAQRLGLSAYAMDLNPIAVMINKSMIEIPTRFIGNKAVNPESNRTLVSLDRDNTTDFIASDVRYYGKRLHDEVVKKIGYLYPNVKLPKSQGNQSVPVVSWIWSRTVKCPNPSCGCMAPLISNCVLSKKKDKEAWVSPVFTEKGFVFEMHYGAYPKTAEAGTKFQNDKGKAKKGTFICPKCKTGIITSSYADEEANNGRMGVIPVAVIAEGRKGKHYLPANATEIDLLNREIEQYYLANDIDTFVPHQGCRGTFASNAQGGVFGFREFKDYFTKRQLISLTTLSTTLQKIKEEIEKDSIVAGYKNDHIGLSSNGSGALAYSEAIATYLAFAIDRTADFSTSISRWSVSNEKAMNCFSKQAISMTWDFPEVNIWGNAVGSFSQIYEYIADCISTLPAENVEGKAIQHDAQKDCGVRNVIVSTDPPYYDNICYSDLSDFFYVWMRKNIGDIYPEVFTTALTPKSDELIATPYRFGNDKKQAKNFFEDGMLKTCQQLYKYASEEFPVTIYYAYKQSETDNKGNVSSSGWETMLNAIINSGFAITGTWPMRTEQAYRTISMGTNALASSIVLVCRKRSENASQITRRNLISILRKELRPALKKLQDSNIAPVDLAQSAIGPGMGVFSRYRKVLEADGTPMSVKSALQVINEEIDLYFNEQVGDLDAMSRFCVDLYTQNAFNDIKFGDADILARAKGTSVAALSSHNAVFAKSGTVHLIERTELSENIDNNESCIWMLTQQLTQAMATGGVETCAKAVFMMIGSNAERAKDLAYRLYTIAEQKKWSTEAFAYNALVVAWPDIQSRAAMMQRETPEQMDMFAMGLLDT